MNQRMTGETDCKVAEAPGPSVDGKLMNKRPGLALWFTRLLGIDEPLLARLSIESTGDEGAPGRAFDMQWTPDNMKAYWMGYDSAMRDVKFGRGDVRVNMFQEGMTWIKNSST